MTEVTQALNEITDIYTRMFGQPVPDIGPGSYAAFPPGVDPVRFAIQEAEELKRILAEVKTPVLPVAWIPRADAYATREAILVRVEIPGVGRDHLKLLVAEGECVVRGERVTKEGDREARPLGLELLYGTFERRFPLPLNAETDKLTAKYADGVLEIRVPLRAAPAPKEMKVEIA